MAQPIWITPAGSLGTIPEGVFYQTPLQAYEPDLGETVYYEVIAGELPSGIQCAKTGLITGVPQAIASIQGVPTEVSQDITSKFAVRAYTERVVNGVTVINRLADRTFTLTVTGQNPPEFITDPGEIATYFDGTKINNLQIEYTDRDQDDVVVKLAAGQLPPGLTISSTGLISGFITPAVATDSLGGFSRPGQGWSKPGYGWSFQTRTVDKNYEFVLEVTDGKGSNLRTFSIFVYSRQSMTADNTVVTADNTFITADVTPVRTPILMNNPGSIGTVRNDNFFAYQFIGLDLDGDPIDYLLGYDPGDSTDLPGLTLDRESGWLYGYIPNLGLTENTYSFYVRVYKRGNPSVISEEYDFTLSVVGPVDTEVTWITDADLGFIDNGATSTLYVAAINAAGRELLYQLQEGSTSSLPQGLQLLPSGEIAGRVSFDTFSLDLGTTTFDVINNSLGTANTVPTTFDMKHTFTVNAYSVDGLVSVFKTFTITVNREYNEPYTNLYIQAMPPQNDRNLVDSLIQDSEIFPPSLIYRYNDPNFGVAKNVVYWHAYGLTAATIADYYSALYENHYWKDLVLGSIKTAQALDADGNVLYEVVYSQVIDDLVNAQGESVDKAVELPYPINQGDSTEVDTVYPNSLINMRDQVIDTVGQISNILPRWMLSKQTDGRVLGFTPAWVIAYCKPGKSGQIAYNIRTQFGTQLNKVDFEVDRYELDNLLTKNWDPEIDSWIPYPAETTFDIVPHYQLPEPNDSSLAFDGGTGYAEGDQILILGSQVGGTDSLNDITITVNTVDPATGEILDAFCQGFAPLFSVGNTYTNVAGTNIVGADAEFTIGRYAQVYTVTVTTPGTDYRIGEQIIISGADLGGATPANDATVTVTDIDSDQGIAHATISGTAVTGTATYTAVSGNTDEGSGATWDIEVVGGDTTTFDGGSVRFIAPVDMYSSTTDYDKYLVFPKRYIIEGGNNLPPVPLPSIVGWKNNFAISVSWNNDSGDDVNWINSGG